MDYKVYVPTNKKYGHLGIKLYEKVGQQWKNAVEYDGNVGDLAPQDLLNYEEQFLVKMKYLIVGFIAVVAWEFGHPYIPGVMETLEHTHECVSNK